MSDSIIERLRHHAQDERNTAFARSTMREAEGHIERLSNDLFDALDCKNGTGPTALSLLIEERDSLRADLAASQAECERLRHDVARHVAIATSATQECEQLRKVALHSIPHKYEGGCPDVTDWSRRDETCPACQIIDAARAGKGE